MSEDGQEVEDLDLDFSKREFNVHHRVGNFGDYAQARLTDREEIRRKLAMGTDEEYYYNERTFKKPSLQMRLQSGMNLQICFMNEADGDSSQDPNVKGQDSAEAPIVPGASCSNSTSTPAAVTAAAPAVAAVTEDEDEDFMKKQTRMQNEAKLALAQACTMAHMQLEVERQLKKKSPIGDMVGIPKLGDGRRHRINRKVLHDMNLGQLQVLVNDLHTQIESLNEELVHMLMGRDDLHMEQDSLLVEIEDLSRRAQEVAQKVTNNNTTTSNYNNRGFKKK